MFFQYRQRYLRPEAAEALMGQQYKVIGRLQGVSIRTVSRGKHKRRKS